MKSIIYLLICTVLLTSCSKTPNPTGIYITLPEGYDLCDFRDDGTAVIDIALNSDDDNRDEIRGSGKWRLEKQKLLFEGTVKIGDDREPGYATVTTNKDIEIAFTIESNGDLITVPFGKYKESVRLIKKK